MTRISIFFLFCMFLTLSTGAQEPMQSDTLPVAAPIADQPEAAAPDTAPLYRPASTVPPTVHNDSQAVASGSVQTGAQRNVLHSDDYLRGKMDGERDARGNALWFAAGLPGVCCYGIGFGGVLFAYLFPPSPPTVLLLGKSAEYVLGYTEGYQNRAKRQNARHALAGCVAGTIVEIALYAILMADVIW